MSDDTFVRSPGIDYGPESPPDPAAEIEKIPGVDSDFARNPAFPDSVYDGADSDTSQNPPGESASEPNAPAAPQVSPADLSLSRNAHETMSTEFSASAQELADRWGGVGSRDYADNLKFADATWEQFSSPELAEVLSDYGRLTDPALVEVAAKICRMLSPGARCDG